MPDFVFFTVTGFFRVLQTDMTDAGGEPDFGTVTGLVTFTPTYSVVESPTLSPLTTVLLQPIQGRIEEDGKLKTLDSAPLYYQDGETRNLCPDGLTPVMVNGNPAYWVDSQGAQTPNPAGTPVYGVRLVANSEAMGPLDALSYRVDFSKVVYDKSTRVIPSFTFTAPSTDVEVDIVNLALGA
jgi:hypothetical protein